jgi:hypothetical protein
VSRFRQNATASFSSPRLRALVAAGCPPCQGFSEDGVNRSSRAEAWNARWSPCRFPPSDSSNISDEPQEGRVRTGGLTAKVCQVQFLRDLEYLYEVSRRLKLAKSLHAREPLSGFVLRYESAEPESPLRGPDLGTSRRHSTER